LAADAEQDMVTALVMSHASQLRYFLRGRVRNRADVPDLVQEIFLRMLRIPDCDAIRSPEAYLFTVAQHVVIQHSMRQSHLQFSFDSPAALERLVDPDPDPVEEISAQQSLRELNSAYELLRPREQATFCYHLRDGLTLKEIAVRLGVTRQMVKKYLEKAILKMRRQLQDIR